MHPGTLWRRAEYPGARCTSSTQENATVFKFQNVRSIARKRLQNVHQARLLEGRRAGKCLKGTVEVRNRCNDA